MNVRFDRRLGESTAGGALSLVRCLSDRSVPNGVAMWPAQRIPGVGPRENLLVRGQRGAAAGDKPRGSGVTDLPSLGEPNAVGVVDQPGRR